MIIYIINIITYQNMSKQTITCNLNCICINSDCIYNHFITYKDRKNVKKFYDSITNKTIEESNNETRKKNCTFGQLCENKNCGFRHRLSYADRKKLIVLYKFNKICPSSNEITNKLIISSSPIKSKNDNTNSFMILDEIENEIEIENKNEIEIETKTEFIIQSSGKSWVDVVKKTNSKIVSSEEIKEIEEIEDDGFYMNF